jgi:hypothetical protein
MTAAAAAGAPAAETGGLTAAVAAAGAAVVAAVDGGVTAGGDGDGVAATDGGGTDDEDEADADAGGVAAGVSRGGDETLAGVVGRGAGGTSTLARDDAAGVVTPAASRAGSCESGRGRRGGSGAVARTVGGGWDLASASDRAGGSDLAGGAGCTAIGGGVSAIAAVGCEGSTVGSGTLGDGEGGAEVTGGRTGDASLPPTVDEAIGAVGIDSGAFDCCMTTTANMAAIPATATSETG